MSVETGGSAETGVGWGRPLPSSRGRLGRRRLLTTGIAEVRGLGLLIGVMDTVLQFTLVTAVAKWF